MNDTIIFEFPLSERIRVFLRLEQLFNQVDHFSQGPTTCDSRAAVASLLDLLTIFGRNDLKSELLKELDRHATVLTKISHSQGVDQEMLQQILDKLSALRTELYSMNGQIGGILKDNDLFQSIALRSGIPGGACSFDLPKFHAWLEQDISIRQQDLLLWLEPLQSVYYGVELIMRYIRQSSMPTEEKAMAGFFQQTLDQSRPYQMLRISTDSSQPYYAEVSGGKHRFTIRFMSSSIGEHPLQADSDINFALTRCVF